MINEYQHILENFYNIAEQDYLLSVSQAFNQSLRLKDIHLIMKVEKLRHNNQNFSTILADATMSSKSTFSNYLNVAEKNHWIKRHRDPENYKRMRIELDSEGLKIHAYVMKYYQALYEFLVKELSPLKLLTISKAILTISNIFSKEMPQFKVGLLTKPNFDDLVLALDRIFFALHAKELDFIEEHALDLSFTDLKVLSSIEILSVTHLNQPKSISTYSRVQFSTLSSILKQLEKKGYVTRQEDSSDHRVLRALNTEIAKAISNDYMQLRLSIHDTYKQAMTEDQYQLLMEAFKKIKQFSNHY